MIPWWNEVPVIINRLSMSDKLVVANTVMMVKLKVKSVYKLSWSLSMVKPNIHLAMLIDD